MIRVAQESKIVNANVAIRAEYVRRLQKVKGKKIHIVNSLDYSTPSLRFRYIDDYVLRDRVSKSECTEWTHN
jgi:histone-lysine N-methyltransferase SUV39H